MLSRFRLLLLSACLLAPSAHPDSVPPPAPSAATLQAVLELPQPPDPSEPLATQLPPGLINRLVWRNTYVTDHNGQKMAFEVRLAHQPTKQTREMKEFLKKLEKQYRTYQDLEKSVKDPDAKNMARKALREFPVIELPGNRFARLGALPTTDGGGLISITFPTPDRKFEFDLTMQLSPEAKPGPAFLTSTAPVDKLKRIALKLDEKLFRNRN